MSATIITNTSEAAPIITIIENSKAKFVAETGFPAEVLHASLPFERALIRYVNRHVPIVLTRDGTEDMQISGLEIRRMGKPSPWLEFYLTADRSGQRHVLHTFLDRRADNALTIASKPLQRLTKS